MRPAMLLLALGAGLADSSAAQSLADRVRARLTSGSSLDTFYTARGDRPVWVSDTGPLPGAHDLLAALHGAAADGLDPADYAVPEDDRAALELGLTRAFLRFASDLSSGRVGPGAMDSMWTGVGDHRPDVAALAQVLDSTPVVEVLHDVRPRHAGYALLRLALEWYRAIAARGGWGTVPGIRGDSGADVRRLGERLIASGDLAGVVPDVFDSVLHHAVRHFQLRHGLVPDGVVGPATLAELNVPVADRIRQMELNLERWRWLPRDPGARHLIVNIPAFTLEAVERDSAVLGMPVVVGRADWQTPIVSATVRHVVFGPAWNIPRAIAVQEVAPLAARDPAALTRAHIHVYADSGSRVVELAPDSVNWAAVTESTFTYRLVQDPGAGNPLGGVKLSFPNQFGVAAHDTPDRTPFGSALRVASHGCVRLARAAELATYLLRDVPPWNADSVAAAMAQPVERWVALRPPVSVHLVYRTVWVDERGLLQFRPDVYGWDAELGRAVQARP